MSPGTGVVLEAQGLEAGYGDALILHGAGVEVREREVVTVIGPNGAGKSTLLKAIVGLLPLRAGTVQLLGEDLAGLPPHEVVRRGVGVVPQLQNVFPNLTVAENLEMGAFLTGPGGAASAQALRHVHDMFPVLHERRREKAGRLSGGQRQMVALGRALMAEPRVLLLDEPSAGLAPNLQEVVFDKVRAIADAGVPVLLVEQNASKALQRSDRGVVLDMGRNRFEGPGATLLASEEVARLYLGGGSDDA